MTYYLLDMVSNSHLCRDLVPVIRALQLFNKIGIQNEWASQ